MHANHPLLHDGYAQVKGAKLYYREVGQGQPLIVLHGGPDFDCNYLLPELDRLSTLFHLIYYDQRGRGRSGENVRPEQVSIESEMEDLEDLRQYFHLGRVAVLGHSWGGLLAMEYATRRPGCVSHLLLMNTAPASHDDFMLFRKERARTATHDLEKMHALSSTPAYQAGDIETEAQYYRLHFKATLRQPEHLEKLIGRLRLNWTAESVQQARAIEHRLYEETWSSEGYSLLPKLHGLCVPSLVIHGAYDLIPVICAEHIAQAIPGASLIVLQECGHFSYLECPDDVYREITGFLERANP